MIAVHLRLVRARALNILTSVTMQPSVPMRSFPPSAGAECATLQRYLLVNRVS